MRLAEVLDDFEIPGLKHGLLKLQQLILDDSDELETKLLTLDKEPQLRVLLKRDYRPDEGETPYATLDILYRKDHDGDVCVWFNSTYQLAYGSTSAWDAPESLHEVAELAQKRIKQFAERNRPEEYRMHLLRGLAQEFPRISVEAGPLNGRMGVAFMSMNSPAKLFAYVAKTQDTPNYERYGYMVGRGQGHIGDIGRVSFHETLDDVRKAVKRWAKTNP